MRGKRFTFNNFQFDYYTFFRFFFFIFYFKPKREKIKTLIDYWINYWTEVPTIGGRPKSLKDKRGPFNTRAF